MANDTTHQCPAPGCTRRVPFHQAFCKAHWFCIPIAMRNRIHASWRKCGETLSEEHVKLLREAAAMLAPRRPERSMFDGA